MTSLLLSLNALHTVECNYKVVKGARWEDNLPAWPCFSALALI